MTNYNEELDEILLKYSSENFDADYEADDAKRELAFTKAKQAITSLIKELVAEAMPEPSTNLTSYEAQMFITSTEEYRQNLLKAMEEV